MLAENVFVTTLEAPEAFAAAGSLLELSGFSHAGTADESRAQWSRGPAKPGYRSLKKLPMRLRMDFDRGRVTLALSIDEPRRPEKLVGAYGLAVLNALQAHVTGRSTLADAGGPIEEADDAVRRRYFRQNLVIWTILGVFIGLIVLGIAAAFNTR